MNKITIHPDRIRQFGASDGCTFCLVTNPTIASLFEIQPGSGYSNHVIRTYDRDGTFTALLAALPEPAHVLVASPECFFDSPPPELLGRRKLIAMACNSTPTDVQAIRHFLAIIERTDPDRLESFAQRFFSIAEESDCLHFVNAEQGVQARFDHLSHSYEWNQQAGPLEWGQQQIAPMGEISVLPVFIRDFDARLRLAVNGEICFHGHPILHNGSPSFLRSDQARIHAAFSRMREHPLLARVRDGEITEVWARDPEAQPAVAMLETLFRVDSRYRILWEIGFAINTFLELLPGNHAMNEVYGGTNGCLHWGLGLTPYTQYHLDIICPGTCVVSNRGPILLGTSQPSLIA